MSLLEMVDKCALSMHLDQNAGPNQHDVFTRVSDLAEILRLFYGMKPDVGVGCPTQSDAGELTVRHSQLSRLCPLPRLLAGKKNKTQATWPASRPPRRVAKG